MAIDCIFIPDIVVRPILCYRLSVKSPRKEPHPKRSQVLVLKGQTKEAFISVTVKFAIFFCAVSYSQQLQIMPDGGVMRLRAFGVRAANATPSDSSSAA